MRNLISSKYTKGRQNGFLNGWGWGLVDLRPTVRGGGGSGTSESFQFSVLESFQFWCRNEVDVLLVEQGMYVPLAVC